MIAIQVELHFCAAHRLVDYDGPCSNPHGHNYRVEIVVEGRPNADGFVADFGVVKRAYGDWIDTHWDHGFVYYDQDPVMAPLYADGGALCGMRSWPAPWNPTAENMAEHLRRLFPKLLPVPGVACRSMRVWETERCMAEASM